MASTTYIYSKYSSFEENIFYISQVQRYLIVFSYIINPLKEKWFEEYLDELYLESLNTLWKTFYFQEDEDYQLHKNKKRIELVKTQLNLMLEHLQNLNEYTFEVFLKTKISLDNKYKKYFEPEFFCKEAVTNDEKKSNFPIRIYYLLTNLIKLLDNKKPLSLEQVRLLEKNKEISNKIITT